MASYALEVRFNGLFLAGAPYEWAPYMLAYQSATFDGAEPGLVVAVPDAMVQAASGRRWADFTAAPLARDGAWLRVGAMPIPTEPVGAYDDDHLWMYFYARTAKPGIPKLEEEEAAAPRSTDLGSVCISQSALLQEYMQNPTGLGNQEFRIFDNVLYSELMQRAIRNAASHLNRVDDAMADPVGVLGAPLMQSLHDAAVNGATKGSISLRLQVDAQHRPVMQRYVETRRALPDSARFNSPEMQQQMAAVVNTLDTQYLVTATDLAPPVGVTADAVQRGRFAANPYSKLVSQLHLVSYKTPVGQLPVMVYMQQSDPAMDARFYGNPEKLERATNEQVASLLAAAFANGQTPHAFLDAIERQYAKTDAGALIEPAFLTALTAIAQTGTDVANARPYQSDLVRPNLVAMAALDPTLRAYFAPDPPPAPSSAPSSSAAAAAAIQPIQERAAAQVLMRGTLHPLALERAKATARVMPLHLRDGAETSAGGAGANKPMTEVERETISSDRFTHIGEPHRSSDCEEGGCTSAHVLEQRYRLATHWLEKRASPAERASLKGRLLAAEARVLSHMLPFFIGGVVSEPYVDTSVQAQAKKTNTPPPHQELPIQGDALSQKSTEGGHGWGKLEPLLTIGRRALDGIERLGVVHPDDKASLLARIRRDLAQVPGWYARVSPLVLEGTGPVYPFVQPAEDVARHLAAQQDKFVRAVKTRKAFLQAISYPKDEHLKTLSQLVRIQTPPYEIKTRPNPMQYTSPFYYQILHAVTPRLYDQWSPALGHTIAVNVGERTRGVEIGAYLRDRQPSGSNNVALVSPHALAFSSKEWKERVEPLLARCRRQLPRTGYLHHFGVNASLQGTPVSSASLSALSGGGGLGGHGPSTAAFSAKELANHGVIETADANPNLTTAQFFVPDWKLTQNASASAQLVGALDALQANGTIAAYAMVSTKPMAQLGQMLHLVVALPLLTEKA